MKFFLLIVLVAIGMVSCKKEEASAPSKIEKTPVSGGITTQILEMD